VYAITIPAPHSNNNNTTIAKSILIPSDYFPLRTKPSVLQHRIQSVIPATANQRLAARGARNLAASHHIPNAGVVPAGQP
jgi:hypothetical protein